MDKNVMKITYLFSLGMDTFLLPIATHSGQARILSILFHIKHICSQKLIRVIILQTVEFPLRPMQATMTIRPDSFLSFRL